MLAHATVNRVLSTADDEIRSARTILKVSSSRNPLQGISPIEHWSEASAFGNDDCISKRGESRSYLDGSMTQLLML